MEPPYKENTMPPTNHPHAETDTPRKPAPWLHERYQTTRCACGSYVTWEWDYKLECWQTDHACRWQQPTRPPRNRN